MRGCSNQVHGRGLNAWKSKPPGLLYGMVRENVTSSLCLCLAGRRGHMNGTHSYAPMNANDSVIAPAQCQRLSHCSALVASAQRITSANGKCHLVNVDDVAQPLVLILSRVHGIGDVPLKIHTEDVNTTQRRAKPRTD